MKRLFFLLLILLLPLSGLWAQDTVKTVKLSGKDFSTIPGTPRVTRNSVDAEWVVAWRQNGSPAKILGRIVEDDGSLKKRRVLAKKVGPDPHSFDLSFDSTNGTYLLAYETSQGLQVRAFSNILKKAAPARLVEAGASGTIARLIYDPLNQQFLLFWISDKGSTLKSAILDSQGNLLSNLRELTSAPAGATFQALSVTRHQATKNLMAVVRQDENATGKLLGFKIKPDGTLISSSAVALSSPAQNFNTFSDVVFTDKKTGLVLWSDDNDIKFRKLKKNGNLAGSIKTLNNSVDETGTTGLAFDARNNLFIGVWTQDSMVRAGTFTKKGAVKDQPFDLENSTLVQALNPAISYDPQSGNALVSWEDSDEDVNSLSAAANPKFRVRGTIFFVGSSSTQRNVSVGDNFFSSANLTISVGDTVVWTNNGFSTHTVTSGNESNSGVIFDSGNMNRGATFSFRFTTAGTFPYYCKVHGSNSMSGTITVIP